MLLILISEILPENGEDDELSSSNAEYVFSDVDAYKQSVENQLCEIVSQIKGAGTVKVMVTVSQTEEYVYAVQTDESAKTEADGSTEQSKSEIVLADSGSESKPIMKKIISPQIGGAVVVCDGAANPQTKEYILNAVTAVLGISSGKVSVVPSQ
jgi:stage III sporulation protein AG